MTQSSAFVVDTNVLVVANGRKTHADEPCQDSCRKKIESVLEDGVIAIDDKDEILSEYGRHLSDSGMSGLGNAFYKHLFTYQGYRDRVRRIPITNSADDKRGFDELPENTLDRSDRKFLAVAVAANVVLLNATDSDWGEQEALIETLGVKVDQLCPQHASKATRRQK